MRVITWLVFILFSGFSYSECSISDIEINSIKTEFINICKNRECFHMEGVAVLNNQCKESIGVEVKVTSFDLSGAPVSTAEFWPASIRNIEPGAYVFSMDNKLRYNPLIHRVEAKVIDIRKWK